MYLLCSIPSAFRLSRRGVRFRPPINTELPCAIINEGVRAETTSAWSLHSRAFIRDAISAPVWYRPSRASQAPSVHPCTDGSLYQDLNTLNIKNAI